MVEKNYQLKKEKTDHRLKLNRQFNYIYKKGERTHTRFFNLFVIKSKHSCYKIGYSVSKKEGKANKRNLLKRRVREVARTNQLPKQYFNYIVQARIGACQLSFSEIEKEMKELFGKIDYAKF